MANSVDPDQTASVGAVYSGSMLFASILNLSVALSNFFAADNFSRQHFQMHFFFYLHFNSSEPKAQGRFYYHSGSLTFSLCQAANIDELSFKASSGKRKGCKQQKYIYCPASQE